MEDNHSDTTTLIDSVFLIPFFFFLKQEGKLEFSGTKA